MNYIELNFTVLSLEDFISDLLINDLSELGFDSFEYTDLGFKAFCASNLFSDEKVKELVLQYQDKFILNYESTLIPFKNWNEVWESNFEPVIVNKECIIRASFHQDFPEFEIQLIIDPKMAFGTGHHDTTRMMCEYLLETDMKNKSVLDMGCGTGILAILAGIKGANKIVAIDNDDVAVSSTNENAALNNVKNIEAFQDVIPSWKYDNLDIIFANINRNILLAQMVAYGNLLNLNGLLFMSGFYNNEDLMIIQLEAAKNKLIYVDHKTGNNWAAAKFIKS